MKKHNLHFGIYNRDESKRALLYHTAAEGGGSLCTQTVFLKADAAVEVNILIPYMEEIHTNDEYVTDIETLREYIKEGNVILLIDASLHSPNNTVYKQNGICGTYLEQELTLAGFWSADRMVSMKDVD